MISEPRSFVEYGMAADQKCFFAIDPRGLIRVWDVPSGRLLATIQGPLPAIRNAVLSPGGRQLAVCVERENTVHLYDCDTGRGRELAGHLDFVSGLAFSPEGGLLATGSMDGSIRLWNTADGQTVAILAGHMQETTDVAFSPDGQTLASVGQGESLKFWHVPTWREVASETVTNAGNWLHFSPDGRRLAVALNDHRVRILEAPAER
jgi:WD40 repeat protein